MEKRKRWQLYVIFAVLALTLYNIMPTILYYSKPLKDPIGAERAEAVATSIIDRANSLEDEAVEWLFAFTKNLGLKPSSISATEGDPQQLKVTFPTEKQALLFRRFLPQAGKRIPFIPSQLELDATAPSENGKEVLVARQIALHLKESEQGDLFQFTPKYTEEGTVAPLYRELVNDRIVELALAFGSTSKEAALLGVIADNPTNAEYNDAVISLAKEIVDAERSLGKTNPILRRWFQSFSQSSRSDAKQLPQTFIARAELIKMDLEKETQTLQREIAAQKERGELLDTTKEQMLSLKGNQLSALTAAVDVVKKNLSYFQGGTTPLNRKQLEQELAKSDKSALQQEVTLQGTNPFVKALQVDWNDDQIELVLYSDVINLRNKEVTNEAQAQVQEQLNQLLVNSIARASSLSDEEIKPTADSFAVNLNSLTNTQSVLAFNLGFLAEKRIEQLKNAIENGWLATHPDLTKNNYPIWNYDTYKTLSNSESKLGLLIYSPSINEESPPEGFKPGSIYIIARGLDAISQKYQGASNSSDANLFNNELQQLGAILKQNGFIGYPGSSYGIDPAYSKDFIFELEDFYSNLLKATRENFIVKGSKRYGILDFTDVEQRIQTQNKIDDRMQEDLLKWSEEYNQAQVSMDAGSKYLVPPPTKSPFWENTKLSFVKYFRGDDRKILKWGLDLSGGKTVRIGLRDQSGRPVTNPDDLKQAVNELYKRINNMGVAERTIRIENENIILDFPGSQGLSASELIKASAMYFHIVNEKFGPFNSTLNKAVNDFLQNVWNEAVVTNRKDSESINEIAWKQLGGDAVSEEVHPRSETAKLLYDNGLRIANPKEDTSSSTFNDALSTVAILRGDDFSEWYGQTHPLIIVFNNYALEGSSLSNVGVSFDPSKGNTLSFEVKGSYEHHEGNPRNDFYSWTSQFAEDQIKGTPKETYSDGRGWRMAAILNNQVISMPALHAALRDGGSITGGFTQREVDQLAADLKAGSLSFTPRILSEQNVSPDLGREERTRGIIASIIALALVFATMVGYYRFAGFVASCALIFNILIMWGVLQNLGAALTLPGIAGIVLTIGMAVDANVLVFERYREEFALSGRVASALQTAYRKAFSAIVDSNVTTIIAAIILLQFDSGPIKGFAVTLIIGILSSMFTALFMTRYFFTGWVQKGKDKVLNMSKMIGSTSYDFLAKRWTAFALSALIIAAGGYLFFAQKNTMFGMDFTGGYSLTLDVEGKPEGDSSYRLAAMEAFTKAGVSINDVDVRELSRPNQLRIQLSVAMEESGEPFYGMPQERGGNFTYPYEANPRINWVMETLEKGGLTFSPHTLSDLDKGWTVMSGQFSDTMRNNAMLALGLALVSILVYITLRFEFKYAAAAVIGLTHDVLITLAILAFFHKMGFAVQINLEIIGALMTIIGYSLNDTIIIFDRIREDLRLYRKWSFAEIINHALNVTLGRTLMTSGTTLVVLLTLVFLGGKAIFGFSLVMTIGVIVGTLSSLFIASPVMLFFHKRETMQLHTTEKKSSSV